MAPAMVEKVGVGCSAVSGGGCEEVKEVVAKKWGRLVGVRGVVLQIGGDDAAEKRDGVQVEGEG